MTEETLKLLENQIKDELGFLNDNDVDPDTETKTVQNIVRLCERLTEAEIANEKKQDNEERRKIEQQRNRDTVEIECRKQNLDWKRMLIEFGKIVVPTIPPMILWWHGFKKMLQFEETGRFTSTASRELHLPKIFNNK